MSGGHEVEAAISDSGVGAAARRVLDLVGRVPGEIITVTSVDGVTRYASPSTFDTLGWQPDELCENLLDLIHADDRPAAVAAWEELLAGPGATATLELRVRTRDERWLWLRSTGRNATDDESLAGVVWNHRDVTDEVLARQQLERRDERFRSVVEHGYDAFAIIDHRQCVEWVSDRTPALLGYDEQDLLGRSVLDFVHPEDHHAAAEALLGFLDGRSVDPVVLRVRTGGGEWLYLDVVGADLRLNPTVGGFLLCLRDVTQRHQAEQELRRNEERFRALLRNAADVIVVFDERAKVTYVSPESELFGREIDQVLGHDALEWVHPEDLEVLADDLAHVLVTEGAHARRTFRILDGHGVWRWVDAAVTNMTDNPAVGGVVANIRDVTARVEAERNAQRLLQIFDATDDQVGITAPDGTLLHVNGAARRHLGLDPDAPLGKVELLDFFPTWELDRIRHEVLPALHEVGTWTGELEIDAPVRGGTLPVAAQFLAHRDAQGRVEHYSAVLRDISERKAFEAQLEHEATHDPLTGLPNRTLLIDRLTMAVNRAQRHGTDVAVLFLDLDHFKVVNDSHGHSLGDALLRGIAQRIAATVRPDDTVARFGGDEFVVVCEELRNDTQALRVAQRVLDSLEAVFGVEGTDIFVGASLGISSLRRSSDDTVTPETLLREADAAMYRAKERGRNQIALFDETLRSRSLLRLDTETALRRALERDELLLHFQPVVDLGSGRVRDLEALVRWAHPDRGLLGPGEFIGIAEETGLIVPLGAWVLDTACRTLAAWRAGSDELHHVGVSVNLSGRQMADDDLVPGLRRILERTGLPPDRLTLEITESLLMDDVEFSHRTLAELRALRVRLAVDDFGTGYSSLSYLRTFPVDVLKVDQSFVADLGTDDGDEAIVAAIVRLAHTLGLEAVAEGVETPAQLARLQALGCDLAQGFHLARPAPAPDTAPLLRRILVT